jgi:hypothetical protein
MENTISVQNVETIVPGGLIRNHSEHTTVAPIPGDDSIFGNLFRASEDANLHTKLLPL